MRRAVALFLLLGTAVFGQQGYLDHAGCDSIYGWAWNPSQPNTPIAVDVYDSATFVTTLTANVFRQDLANEGVGNGYHGFSMAPPSALKDSRAHNIRVYFSGTQTLLGYGADYSIACAPNGYAYYQADTFATINANNWTQNGSLTSGASGLGSTDANGGSLISKLAVPDGTSDYEVRANLTITQSGGAFVFYLHASADAMSGPAARGTAYAIEMANPVLNAGACTATLGVYKIISGAVTELAQGSIGCSGPTSIRVVSRSSIFVYANDQLFFVSGDTSIAAGQPGVGVRSTPAGNSISSVSIGALERTPPASIDRRTVATSSLSNRVDVRWQPTTYDPAGIGLAFYQLWRDGVYIATLRSPGFTDETVQPGITYAYDLSTVDFHQNYSPATRVTVTTPPAGSIDPRRTGVRPTGSYWGSLGENLDVLSGNLNFTIPLLRAQGRGGSNVGFNLTYNSQNWRYDNGATWKLGQDVGYGFGWNLLAGSIRPYWLTGYWGVIDHYTLTDATGAEYRLDVNTNGVWTSTESIYVSYDASTNRVYFTDGSFWVMGCTSAGTEQDAGTMYPTLMQDTNGNQILIRYNPGVGVTWNNSSARIQQIEDVRAPAQNQYTYSFAYSNDPVLPHLTAISNVIGTAEAYSIQTSGMMPLNAPWVDPNAAASSQFLQSLTLSGVGVSYQFSTSDSGALTRAVLPYAGYLRWDYVNQLYLGSRYQPEVSARYLSKDGASGSELTYAILHDSADTGRTHHFWTVIDDPGQQGEKSWQFSDGAQWNTQRLFMREDRVLPSRTAKRNETYTWSQDAAGNYYIGSVLTTLDPGTADQVQTKAEQTLDAYGNVTQTKIYDYGNLTTPVRTYTNRYVTDPNYTSRYIFNRLFQSKVNNGGPDVTLVTNYYDGTPLTARTGLREHDDANYGTGFSYRGNVTSVITPSSTTTNTSDVTGMLVSATDGQGHRIDITPGATTNNAAPGAITPNNQSNLATSVTYNPFLAPATVTQPNNAQSSTTYDAYGRVATTTSVYGAVTTYTYADTAAPPTHTATTNGHWVRTTMDGLGRTIKTEAGDATETNSVVEVVYGPCGCSPVGKMMQQSLPHKPADPPNWTMYVYDGLGRTVTVTAPDGSVTSYAYSGNQTTVTDAAGKWKTLATDALGNLSSVTEPDPGNAPNGKFTTSYSYDALNHLTQVNMPRQTGTQTRTFTYNAQQQLASATNPENGTMTYSYNLDGTLAARTDALGQKVAYQYDSFKRVIEVDRYAAGATQPNACDTVALTWDQPLAGAPYGTYPWGRLSQAAYGGLNCASGAIAEQYFYLQSGLVAQKSLVVTRSNAPVNASGRLTAGYSYDNEGKVIDESYPNTNNSWYRHSYDTMSRLTGITEYLPNNQQTAWVSGAAYGPGNQLTALTYLSNGAAYAETREYNSRSRQQLTRINVPGVMDMQYTYAATPNNNGRIAKQKDAVSGEEISYAYDSLNRLITAARTDGRWSMSFSYDGFGNRTGQAGSGTAPSMSLSYDANNHITTAGYGYDANGNLTATPGTNYVYDIENRLAGYMYNLENRRIADANGTNLTFWGVDGRRIGAYTIAQISQGSITFQTVSTNLYFRGKMIRASGSTVVTDRLGSVRANLGTGERFAYYPYGEEQTATANGREKFGTYFRDSGTGLDYADQRYYSSTTGRFWTPDPAGMDVVDMNNPTSWNMYAYVNEDPVNFNDPDGLGCNDVLLNGWDGIPNGMTVKAFLAQNSNLSILADTIFAESRVAADQNAAKEKAVVAAVIMNRWEFVNGYWRLFNGPVQSGRSG